MCVDPDCDSKPGHVLKSAVHGYELCQTATTEVEGYVFTHCPEADIADAYKITDLWLACDDGNLSALRSVIPNPTAALYDAFAIISQEVAEYRKVVRERSANKE